MPKKAEYDFINKEWSYDYEKTRFISSGTFGKVIEVKKKGVNEKRAIKLISKTDDFDFNLFKKEVNLLKELENNNSIKIFEIYNSDEDYAIVMELCDCNLLERLNNTSNGLKVDEIKKILEQLNNTFKIMFKNKIIHRDIKLQNILLKYVNDQQKDYIVKLTDYGINERMTKHLGMSNPKLKKIKYIFVFTLNLNFYFFKRI